jgi:hypothetical protein
LCYIIKMQIKGGMPPNELSQTLDAGVELLHQVLQSLTSRGLSLHFGSSALATAVAGALTYEGVSAEQFLTMLHQTLRLWRIEQRDDGPALIFDSGPLSGGPRASEEASGGN